jgi:hypothetical protein
MEMYFKVAPQNFEHDFRFEAESFWSIPDIREMPDYFVLDNRTTIDVHLALGITLRRLGHASGTIDLSAWYGLPSFYNFSHLQKRYIFISRCFYVSFLNFNATPGYSLDGPQLWPQNAPWHPLVVFCAVEALRLCR